MVTTSGFGKTQGAARMITSENRKYEHSERDRAILQLLASGEREIEAGEGYDLDSILANADALLAQEPKA
jgi:hypothetical protein